MTNMLLMMGRILAKMHPAVAYGTLDGADASPDIYDQTKDTNQITDIADFAATLNLLLRKILGPILLIIGVFSVIWAIYLGVQYAKAEDSTKRKEVQGRLIAALIGAVIIIVAATLCLAIDWSDVYYSFQDKHTMVDLNKDNWCDYCGKASDHPFHGA